MSQYVIILKSHSLFPFMRVLFVCVGNSCRSQMAEAIARSQGMTAESAGTHPAKEVSKQALHVLADMRIDASGLVPKNISTIDWKSFDKIISMGCGVQCPNIPIDEDWGLEDPVGGDVDIFRKTAKRIQEHIKNLA